MPKLLISVGAGHGGTVADYDALDRPRRRDRAPRGRLRRELMTKALLSLTGLALAAAIFASPAWSAPKARCYMHGCNRAQCMGSCQLGDRPCFSMCRALFPKRAAATRSAGPVLHGGYTNPTGPTLPPTHNH